MKSLTLEMRSLLDGRKKAKRPRALQLWEYEYSTFIVYWPRSAAQRIRLVLVR